MGSDLRVMIPAVVTDKEAVSVCLVTVPATLEGSGGGWHQVSIKLDSKNHQDAISCCVKEELVVAGGVPVGSNYANIAEIEDDMASKLEKLAIKDGVDAACSEFVNPVLPKLSRSAWDGMSAVARTTLTFADLNLMEMLAYAATDMRKWDELNYRRPASA